VAADYTNEAFCFQRTLLASTQRMNDAGPPFPDQTAHAEFPSTQWSKVLNAGHGDLPGGPAALENLCRAYWPPLYSFVRWQGHSPHDAEDLVQGFLARVLAREDLAEVGPDKGRFRTFLLTSLRNFVVKQALRDKALKRGGGQIPISINTEEAERLCGPDLTTPSPEAAFDRRFAQAVVTRAFAALREEHRARGKEVFFETLSPYLDGAEPDAYDQPAAKLGMASGTVAVTVHRMRGRLRELLRAEVRQLCSSAAEEEQELKHLLEVWSR
jgi:RNA polymerase sigma factor (sigma-70 family)